MSIPGLPILAYQVRPNPILLLLGSGLAQPQVLDLVVGVGSFESPFAETPFLSGHLDLLFEEVDLAT